MPTRESVKLVRKRIMRFNEEMPDYNPIFLNQGDSEIKQAFGDFLEVFVDIDADVLSGIDLSRKTSAALNAPGGRKFDPRDVRPHLSPLAPQARSIARRVHKTLPGATTAYRMQIERGVEQIKSDSDTANKAFEALKRKGVSTTVARETIKMIERGVPAEQIKKEVTELVNTASKIPALPRRTARVVSIRPGEIVPEIVMRERDTIPSVTRNEIHEVAIDLKSDPVIKSIAETQRKPVELIVTSIANNQIDEVLKTIATAAIIEGVGGEPTDSQISRAAAMPTPKPIFTSIQPKQVTTRTMSSVAQKLGVPAPMMAPSQTFRPAQIPVPVVDGRPAYIKPTAPRKPGPLRVPSSFPMRPPHKRPPAKVVESPFEKAGAPITEVITPGGGVVYAPMPTMANQPAPPPGMKPAPGPDLQVLDPVKQGEALASAQVGIPKWVWGAGIVAGLVLAVKAAR